MLTCFFFIRFVSLRLYRLNLRLSQKSNSVRYILKQIVLQYTMTLKTKHSSLSCKLVIPILKILYIFKEIFQKVQIILFQSEELILGLSLVVLMVKITITTTDPKTTLMTLQGLLLGVFCPIPKQILGLMIRGNFSLGLTQNRAVITHLEALASQIVMETLSIK